MKRSVAIILFFLWFFAETFATHNRAGEITYKLKGGFTYEITITTYTKNSSPADRCDLSIHFGDGDSTIFNRINGPKTTCNPRADGELISGTDIKKNIYRGEHTYPGGGSYKIWMQDPNRVSDVKNIPNSVNVPFALETVLIINPILGDNSSPVLLNPPIDNACQGVCFYHNPGAHDPDGDSLSYELTSCLGATNVSIVGYTTPPTTGTIFIDAVTGDFEWCTPPSTGIYNIAILIKEWRTIGGQRFLVGTVLRDMQIDVLNCTNKPPLIDDVNDTCVEAGELLTFPVTASDPNNHVITLTAAGGPLSSSISGLPATFPPVTGPSPVTGTFSWQTDCEHVRKQPYLVSFRAEDNGIPKLADYETVKITIVAPAPENPIAKPLGTSVHLTWEKSICNPANNKFIGYKVYRKDGPSGWNHGYCETGVPDYAGYTLIADMNLAGGKSINDTFFTDNNNGTGLIHGLTYCYRVVAHFLDGAESYASVEVCTELKNDVPIITNVDVVSTGLNDTIFIKWIKPVPDSLNFDTISYPGPYKFELMQSEGANMSNPTAITAFTSNVFSTWKDTSYFSIMLNTRDSAYSYRVDFYSDTILIGSSHIASSTFLSISPSDNQLTLNWQANVPWNNYLHYIYKETSPGVYSLYDSTASNQYIDLGLTNGTNYCYYVLSKGEYTDPDIIKPLYNRSQKKCATPIDLLAPCSPQLKIIPDCDLSKNTLTWNNPNNTCSNDVAQYNIYYAPVQGEPLTLLTSIIDITDTIYEYFNTRSIAGCFLVAAVDSSGNESENGVMFCVDNCPVYELPNVFTPDGDGINEKFIPLKPYKYVKDIDIKIYNRWGMLLFETSNPDILWDGKNKDTGEVCPDGTYFYTCIVNEIRVYGIQPRELKGFIHLIHGKNNGSNN